MAKPAKPLPGNPANLVPATRLMEALQVDPDAFAKLVQEVRVEENRMTLTGAEYVALRSTAPQAARLHVEGQRRDSTWVIEMQSGYVIGFCGPDPETNQTKAKEFLAKSVLITSFQPGL